MKKKLLVTILAITISTLTLTGCGFINVISTVKTLVDKRTASENTEEAEVDPELEKALEEAINQVLEDGKVDDSAGMEEADISEVVVPRRYEFQQEYLADEAAEFGTLKAYDEADNLLWEYTTDKIMLTELDQVQVIGEIEQGFCFLAGGSVYCIGPDGTPAWVNEEFMGAGASFDMDNIMGRELLYLTGYYGPDLMVIDIKTGATYERYDQLNFGSLGNADDFFWPYSLVAADEYVEICFDSNSMQVQVDPADGTVLSLEETHWEYDEEEYYEE